MAEKKPKYLKGQLLLDSGQLHGSFFHRSVVLVCQHDAQGAFGLILNRRSETDVGAALVAELPSTLKKLPLFVGGPVQPEALSFLHSDTFVPHANVLPNLNLGHSLEALADLGESYSTTQKVRIFAGYAGWSAGQLESEIKRSAWIIQPASLKLVFRENPETLWQTILRAKDWPQRLLAEAPEDLNWN